MTDREILSRILIIAILVDSDDAIEALTSTAEGLAERFTVEEMELIKAEVSDACCDILH